MPIIGINKKLMPKLTPAAVIPPQPAYLVFFA